MGGSSVVVGKEVLILSVEREKNLLSINSKWQAFAVKML